MFRYALLAALLCSFVWASSDRAANASSGDTVTATGAASWRSEAPDDTDGPDRRWEAAHRASASLTESVWKSQLHHATLSGVVCLDRFSAVREGVAALRQARNVSQHLLHVPLLI